MGLFSPGWRAANPGLPYAALSGQESRKASHRASSQQTDTVLSRHAGTRLPDEPIVFENKEWTWRGASVYCLSPIGRYGGPRHVRIDALPLPPLRLPGYELRRRGRRFREPDSHPTLSPSAVGETSMVPTAPAVINAIKNATGIWVCDLPASPDKIKALAAAAQPKP